MIVVVWLELSVVVALMVLATLIGIWFLMNYNISYPKSNLLPKGRMGWPLLGETISYLKPHKSTILGSFLQEHCSIYGKVFKSNLFGCSTIVSCDHELNTFVLQNEDKLFESSYPSAIHGILGKFSMMLVTGDHHRKLRAVAVGFIGKSKSRPDFFAYVEAMTISLMDSWKLESQIAFFKQSKRFTLFVMLKYVMDMEADDPLAPRMLEDFMTYMKGFVSVPVQIPGTAFAKAVKARERLSNTVKEVMRARVSARSINNINRGDLIDEMIEIDDDKLSEEEKVSVALDILLAGYETTSGLMALVVYFLAQSPISIQSLIEEHKPIRLKKIELGEPLNSQDYKQMNFTSNVIWEALRCGNLVKFLHRKAIKEVRFKGRKDEYVIPAGWKVLPVLAGSHLDSSLHPNPSEFNPQRWTNDQQEMMKKVIPFGGGSRLCPGGDLGRLETSIFLHHFVLNYRWKIQTDESPLSRPYLDFNRGMLLDIEPFETGKC